MYLSQSLPITLHFGCLFSPLFANNFRYLWVCESRILGNNLSLVMLAVKDESYKEMLASESDSKGLFG